MLSRAVDATEKSFWTMRELRMLGIVSEVSSRGAGELQAQPLSSVVRSEMVSSF